MPQLQWAQQIAVGPANYSGSSKLQWVQQITVGPANYVTVFNKLSCQAKYCIHTGF